MGLIHLYSATSTSFDGNGTPLVTAREAVVKRDEGFQLTFSIPISQNELHKLVQKEMIVSAMTPDGVNYFRIWDIEKRTTDVKVTALQLLYSLDVKQINPFGGKQYTGNSVLQAFVNSFKSSISPYTFSSSILTLKDFDTNEKDDTSTSHNALAILNKITDHWSGELMLNGFDVRMISKLGTKTDALLYEHKNIASFSDSSSMNGIVTRIYATATYTPERAEGATEDPEPVVLTATVDSPLINQYAVIYEATMEYNDARTVAELRTEILKQYSEFNVDKPERTIDVDTNIVDGTAINFGDELVLKYLVHDVDEVIRCVGYEYDPISENYIGVTLGTLEKTFLTKVTEGISSSVSSQLDKINRDIQGIQTAANGKNRIAYGPSPVPNPIEGDLWFYHPEGRPDEVELLVYQNGLWLPAPFLTDQDKADFDQAMNDHYDAALAEIERKDAEYKEIFDNYDEQVVAIDKGISDAATKAQSALEEAGISTDLAQTAKDLATTAQTNANQAKSDASTALENANLAKTDASQAVIDANTAKTDAQTAINNASTAITQSGQAISSANTAKTNAQTALDNAQTALTTAGSADTKAGQAIAKANAIPTTITDIIADKNLVNGSYVDTKVDAATGAWSQELVKVEGRLDGLEVGGRNLWIQSDTVKGGVVSGSNLTISGTHHHYMNSLIKVQPGQKILYQVWNPNKISATSRNRIAFYDTSDVYLTQFSIPILNGTTYQKFEFTAPANSASVRLASVQGSSSYDDSVLIKYEFGNVATDWTPAPEDLYSQEEFKIFNAQYTQDVTGMTGRLTTVENTKLDGSTFQTFKETEYQVTADKVASTITRVDTAEGKITTQGTAISQNATAIASKADKTVVDTLSGTVATHTTEISQNATAIASKASSTSVSALTGRVSTAETTISQHATSIASKASQTELDSVNGTVSGHTTTLSQHAKAIASKAESSLVNTIKGTVDTHTTEIAQNATDIASKASSTSVNTLTGRVDTAESNISQNATAITQRVTTTTYNAGMSSKENAVLKQSTAPTHANGKLWLDTSVTPNVLKRSTGTAWVKATPTTPGEVGAYSQSDGAGLAGRLTTAETNITQTATAITSKADKSTVDTLAGTVDTHTTEIAQNATAIASKASTSSVNTLTGRVSTAETTISQHATSIASKASQTEVDTVKGTVSGHTTTLSQHATSIASKASTSSVNTLTGRVSTAETNISQNATAISARLTSSQVNSLVDGKGLATSTYVNNQISATASGIRTDLTKVEGKIDGLQVGGRNLFRDSTNLVTISVAPGVYTSIQADGTRKFVTESGNQNYTSFSIPNTAEAEASFKEGDDFTVSLTIKRTLGSGTPSVYIKPGMGYFPLLGNLNSEWSTLYYTGKWKKVKDIVFHIGWGPTAGTFFIKNIKLEKGNIATDWTPAPEDTMMENDFNTFKASYEATAENLTSRLTAIDKTGGRLDVAESQINQLPNLITTTVSEVRGTIDKLGGTGGNLVANGGFENGDVAWENNPVIYKNTKHSGEACLLIRNTVGSKSYMQKSAIPVIPGNVYRLSFWYLTDAFNGDSNETKLRLGKNDSSYTLIWDLKIDGATSSWKYRESDFIAPSNVFEVVLSLHSNHSTGWIMYDDVSMINVTTDTKVSQVTQKADSLIAKVGSNGEKISQLVMTDSVFQTSIVDKISAVSTYSKTYRVNTASPATLTDINGYNLNPEKSYDIVAGVRSTSTITNFICSLIPNGNDSWSMSVHSQSGTHSNHPYIYIQLSTGLPRVRLYDHTTFYTVEVTITESGSRNRSALTMLSDNINLRVAKDGLVGEMNIQAGKTIIRQSDNVLMITPDTTYIQNATIKSAHIDTLNANKIVGNTADFNAIRTGVLTADAVTATHIKADSALFNTLFSTTSATSRLAAIDAWIRNANIISINADKITAGTIHANRISTSSLNNVSLGGRNYLRNSGNFKSLRYWNAYAGIETVTVNRYLNNDGDIHIRIGSGTPRLRNITLFPLSAISNRYTISVEYVSQGSLTVTGKTSDSLTEANENGHQTAGTFTVLGTEVINGNHKITKVAWDTLTATSTRVASWLMIQFLSTSNYYLRSVMVERGDVATKWTPAPEDLPADLARTGEVVIHGGNIKADTLDVGAITGNTATFISKGFKSLNSQSTINGHAIRIQNSAGEFVEMNNTPELRSDDAGGTAVVLGKGRVHFYDSRGHSKGYVGTDMHTAGSYDFGTFLSKGSGIYKFARMADATQTTYAYYTVKSGLTAPASVITNMVQNGYLPDGNSQQFVAKGNMLSQLNGWPNYPNWPTLKAGQQIRYKEVTSQTTGDAYEDIWKFGPSSAGDWRIYFAKHATFEGGTTGASDRRLKHDIETTQIEALHHIESLTFKEFRWNRDNKYEPIGLIAQDSGIIRVADDDMEGIDIQRAIMLGLKGVQELNELAKAQAEEIRQLKEIINQ